MRSPRRSRERVTPRSVVAVVAAELVEAAVSQRQAREGGQRRFGELVTDDRRSEAMTGRLVIEARSRADAREARGGSASTARRSKQCVPHRGRVAARAVGICLRRRGCVASTRIAESTRVDVAHQLPHAGLDRDEAFRRQRSPRTGDTGETVAKRAAENRVTSSRPRRRHNPPACRGAFQTQQ